jgi:hypothetical protein
VKFVKDAEKNSVALRIRKTYQDADMSSHTVMTDDVFSYVDFYFKTHKKNIKDSNGKPLRQNHSFYWGQARNLYNAAKILPIESSALPMYYCMLNAVKAYLLYCANDCKSLLENFNNHGLGENPSNNSETDSLKLENIMVFRKERGVFCEFSKKEDKNFDSLWKSRKENSVSLKELISQLPFVHSAYVYTYKIPRKEEKFIPLEANHSPKFMYSKENKIRLVADIDKHYFKQNATSIPNEILETVPKQLALNPDKENAFQLYSRQTFKKADVPKVYNEYRRLFVYINADKRLWYLRKEDGSNLSRINTMSLEMAIAHRFSEIVRYKSEQMQELLSGKENWLIHECLSLMLDQFMDEISCEITKQEIMHTRIK